MWLDWRLGEKSGPNTIRMFTYGSRYVKLNQAIFMSQCKPLRVKIYSEEMRVKLGILLTFFQLSMDRSPSKLKFA